MEEIQWGDFEKVQILAGTIIEVQAFPELVNLSIN